MMLVKDLISQLPPKILNNLTLSQLTLFAALSGKFFQWTDNNSYGTTAKDYPIKFLPRSLDPEQPISTWVDLWSITWEDISSCAYNTLLFQKHGIPDANCPENATIIPEHTFGPPNTNCLICDPATSKETTCLRFQDQVYGYLFNIGGVETVQYFLNNCYNLWDTK
ncbi:hypothetical protein DFH28DRAFT_1164562 [Melampsora americana]|nr:hypothetical protein DFH28DRAFT_1164562 [Melampsora americana]